ncbi:SAM-dependent methyltransferase [Nocardioides perillae]|uniref:Cyclopropane-fatty-acyl-phospholipid synthase n=1 Tax=Nocardioides perillae TaxID=1119534 RepID=A0A7Y9RP92_9ACTN|nr:cyclopropane-fatty-acyl-phospholipid synthase family protein [Nocardioides perillae]NYG54037.1 cyclopropane-fatty-acyl-phospholipid synthase [Nocardioides perillae]
MTTDSRTPAPQAATGLEPAPGTRRPAGLPAGDPRPDPATWQVLGPVPRGPRAAVAARIARRIFRAAVSRLHVTVHLPGETLGRGGPSMVVRRPDEFFARLGSDGLIGFGEAYMTGAWESEDAGGFLAVLAAQMGELVPEPLQRLRAAYVRRPPRHQQNTQDNTRGNISHHYDLSNAMFELFLDPTLTYSSALFDTRVLPSPTDHRAGGVQVATPPGPQPVDDALLTEAQGRKIERLLDATGVTAGIRVLEIGTGWGELAIRAARRGATVHSVTLSTEQQALAQQRIAAAGLADRVTVELCDYRSVTGTYDAVVSVEMVEAVGWEFWPTYFATIDARLAPGGRAGVQAILMPHDRMLATRRTWTWINKYIFPGGFLPSVEAVDEAVREHTSLRLTGRTSFGSHYAETLRQWDVRFLAHADDVRGLGFDDTFLRMWHLYLEYSRAGFASGYLDVEQMIFTRPEETR